MRIAILALAFAAALLTAPQPTQCDPLCGNVPCINSNICFQGCACVISPTQGIGTCRSVR
ncbi:unnamed protein product [marine sediment metagenome]|uniref:Uncharacterized protein n=1 Tax=marine sediment metagenome TaxID=412755 RepID=X0UKU5_9ZZZZ